MTLKERRKMQGLTQQELGTMIGVDQSAIHQWETGKTKPRKYHLAALAKLFNCSEKELTQDLDQLADTGKKQNHDEERIIKHEVSGSNFERHVPSY